MQALDFLIKPVSHRCNLKCGYCFYRQTADLYPNAAAAMTRDVAECFVQKALGLGAVRNTFCWQGGEPTLAGVDFYRAVAAAQKRHARSYQIVENSIQSNGVLLDEEWCRFLKDERFLVGLSLDGPADVHDRYRCFADGSGSYALVMAAADRLRRHAVPFNILTLLTAANVERVDDLYAHMRANRFSYLQFIPCLEIDPVSRRPQAYSISAGQLGGFYCRLFDLWMADGFPYVSVRLFEDILIFMLDGLHTSCSWQSGCRSYLLVEHNGDCFPCDFYVRQRWKLGNLTAEGLGPILGSPLLAEFARRKAALPETCRSCAWLNFCNGDCPRYRPFPEDGSDGRSLFCDAWQMLFEHIEPVADDLGRRADNLRRALATSPPRPITPQQACPCGSGRQFGKCCGRERSSPCRAFSTDSCEST